MQSLARSHPAAAYRPWGSSNMGSSAGALGALAVLLALPMAVLSQTLGMSAALVVHVLLGIGTLLVARSAFQFTLPGWLTWSGCVAATGLGVIFLLQGLTELTMSESLRAIAYGVLGQWPEGLLGTLVVAWFMGPLVLVSRGKTKLLGWLILPIVLAFGALHLLPGVSVTEAIPGVLPLLFAFAWFLLEAVQTHRQPA